MGIEARREGVARVRSLAVIEAELATARDKLQRLEDAFDRYTGNNPNKLDQYSRDIRYARSAVELLEAERAGQWHLTIGTASR